MSDAYANLERIRVQLEENIQKLKGLLKHWQTWEAEYEGLKEGLGELGDNTSRMQLERVADEYKGQLLTQQGMQKTMIE
jgi:unconventional prefoldin RPB5 interactor 1